jgi:hypothetical protein
VKLLIKGAEKRVRLILGLSRLQLRPPHLTAANVIICNMKLVGFLFVVSMDSAFIIYDFTSDGRLNYIDFNITRVSREIFLDWILVI